MGRSTLRFFINAFFYKQVFKLLVIPRRTIFVSYFQTPTEFEVSNLSKYPDIGQGYQSKFHAAENPLKY